MKNIVIVDDHNLIAEAISLIINKFENFKVIYTCENGKELTQVMRAKGIPDIILLDISMPEMDGIETAQWLTQNYPEVLIMALSMQNDDHSLLQMIKNGAKGFLLKNINPVELKEALNKLIDFGYFFPSWVTQKVYLNISEKDDYIQINSELSDREIEFLKHCATELNYKEIADLMCCSPRSLEYYRDNLFSKLNIKTRVGLALYAIKNGYAEFEE